MLNYNFIRENELNSKELHLLMIISSYSKESHIKCSDYAQMMKVTTRTIKRLTKALREKGFISVRYGQYKSIHITVLKGTFTVVKRDTGVHHKGHGCHNQYREHKENIKRAPPYLKMVEVEERNPANFTKKPEEVRAMIRGVIKRMPKA